MDNNIINISPITDGRGKLLFMEEHRHIPFDIKRIYYIYDVPEFIERGKHAHHDLQQAMFVLGGSMEIELDDGSSKITYTLDSPDKVLIMPKLTWRVMRKFSPGAICVVMASLPYSEEDYIRNYNDFLTIVNG
jgi:hypothetical protein